MGNAQRAAVVMLRGTGEQRLQTAIQQGLLQDELMGDVQAVLQESQETKAQNEYLTAQYNQLQYEIRGYQDTYRDALRAQQREQRRKSRWDDVKAISILALIVFVMVLASELLCGIILK